MIHYNHNCKKCVFINDGVRKNREVDYYVCDDKVVIRHGNGADEFIVVTPDDEETREIAKIAELRKLGKTEFYFLHYQMTDISCTLSDAKEILELPEGTIVDNAFLDKYFGGEEMEIVESGKSYSCESLETDYEVKIIKNIPKEEALIAKKYV
jgi:hypothetical protein